MAVNMYRSSLGILVIFPVSALTYVGIGRDQRVGLGIKQKETKVVHKIMQRYLKRKLFKEKFL